MKLYLIRHGKTEDAEQGLSQHHNSKLSPAGKEKLLKTKKYFENISLDKIYCSPYHRTQETAEIIFKDNKEITETLDIVHEYLKPSHLQGKPKEEAEEYWLSNLDNLFNPDWKPDDGESLNDIIRRANRLIDQLKEKHINHNIAVVTHGIFIRHFVGTAIMGKHYTPEVFFHLLREFSVKNGGVVELELTNDKFKLIQWVNF